MKKHIYKIVSLALACIVALTSLAGCSSAITPSAQDIKVVGTVGAYEVLYEELYFLVNSYRSGLEDKYGEYQKLDAEKAAQFDEELRELVYTNIVTNYAILALCEQNGLTLEDDGLEKRVEEYVEATIEKEFGNSKSEYKKSLEAYGLTDHYFRFTVSVDLLYSDLLTKLLEEGKIEDDDEKIKEIVKNEFVRTWHIMITNDEGESVEDNRKKAEEALAKYRDGSMSMYKLIGSAYNEDYSLTELDGFYFTKGSMEEAYENAAFALEVGEVSDVVEAAGTNTKGESVSAFYIIQRLEIEDDYIEKNLPALEEKYRESVIYTMVEEKGNELSFIPNDYAKSLTLATISSKG